MNTKKEDDDWNHITNVEAELTKKENKILPIKLEKVPDVPNQCKLKRIAV